MKTKETIVLEVKDLRKSYGGKIAVDGVSFHVKRGEIVGLLGPNGAGKTTTINMLLSVLSPTSGSITVMGADLAGQRQKALMRTNFAAVYAPLPGNLSVAQNLTIFAMLYGVKDKAARVDEMIARFDLARLRDIKCGVLSTGEQMRVCMAKALLNKPDLLLLDEPTGSLDPSRASDIRARIRAYVAETGCGVLWTSHNMPEVEEVCDRALFLSRGRILLEGDPKTLASGHGQKTLEELFIALAQEAPEGR